jgi:hypothetical protein
MVALLDLWLPILLSAVFVFVVSSVLHMLIPLHRKDYGKLPDEDGLLAAMRSAKVTPGSYMFPLGSSMKDMASPEMLERQKLGPVGFMTIVPNGPYAMGKALGQWFVLSLVISLFVAYVGSFALEPGAEYLAVFRLTGTIAVVVYALGNVTDSIWKGVRWGITAKFVFDGVCYGLVTGGAFGWLWPGA